MKLEIEVPDDWMKKGNGWHSSQLLSCNQCDYKTPLASLYVTHVFLVHGAQIEAEEQTLILDK